MYNIKNVKKNEREKKNQNKKYLLKERLHPYIDALGFMFIWTEKKER